jgi:hypothetical protein
MYVSLGYIACKLYTFSQAYPGPNIYANHLNFILAGGLMKCWQNYCKGVLHVDPAVFEGFANEMIPNIDVLYVITPHLSQLRVAMVTKNCCNSQFSKDYPEPKKFLISMSLHNIHILGSRFNTLLL